MKLHPRSKPVQKAGVDISMTLDRLQQEHGLTDVEMAQALYRHLGLIAKSQLRAERHPDDPDKSADEA